MDRGQIISSLTGRGKMCACDQVTFLPIYQHVNVHTQPCMHVVNIATGHLYMYINVNKNVYQGIATQFRDNALSNAL